MIQGHRLARNLLLSIALACGCGGTEGKTSPDAPSSTPDTGAGGTGGTDGPATPDGPSKDAPTADGATGDGPAAGAGMIQGRLFRAGTGMPVVGGSVRTSGGLIATSDAQGGFSLTAVPAGNVALQASGTALAETTKVVQVTAGMGSYVELFLAPVDAQTMINAQNGGEVRSDSTGARAQFLPNSLVDSSGNTVQGMVQVSVTSIDPSQPEELRAFPGSFRAIRSDASDVAIETFGPMEISASANGQPLDLRPGMSAEIAFPIYDRDAPATIELWSLNEATGVWKEEGVAYRTEDDDGHPIYRATIGHMSWWNPDRPIERTCVRTCVTSNGSPVVAAVVKGMGVGYGYEVNGYTGSDGCVSLRVQRNRQVTLQAAALAGVSTSILVQAPDSPEANDPTACMMVQTLSLGARPADGCPSGMTKCGERCVDLTNSANNCGACGTVCGSDTGPYGSTCVMGACACGSNQLLCDGACVDPSSDRFNCGGCSANGPVGNGTDGCAEEGCCAPLGLTACPRQDRFYCTNTANDRYNCGGCGVSCNTGQECKEGSCAAIVCPAGQTLCGDRCIQGPCGETCEYGERCSAGKCAAIVCPSGLQLCGNNCVDIKTDSRNCGACDMACEGQEGAVCTGGTCGCAAGSSQCSVGSNLTACVNLMGDRYNCGTCGHACPPGNVCSAGQCTSASCPQGQLLCGETCVDVKTDSSNCGGCTAGIGEGDEVRPPPCQPGACQCQQGYLECPYGELAACLNVQTDNRNCGDCGVVCDTGERCTSGSCQPITCPQGTTLCDGRCVFGSVCGDNCNAGEAGKVCVAGSCQCPSGWQLCEGGDRTACRDVSSDDRNCGACGTVCKAGLECKAGQCQPIVCPQGQISCGQGCVDTQTDRYNCGGCTPPVGAAAGCYGEGCCERYGLTGCGYPDTEAFACTSLSSDPYNCGTCGTQCTGNQICSGGQCAALVCPAGQVACSHQCLPGSTCGTRCQEDGQSCVAGVCQ